MYLCISKEDVTLEEYSVFFEQDEACPLDIVINVEEIPRKILLTGQRGKQKAKQMTSNMILTDAKREVNFESSDEFVEIPARSLSTPPYSSEEVGLSIEPRESDVDEEARLNKVLNANLFKKDEVPDCDMVSEESNQDIQEEKNFEESKERINEESLSDMNDERSPSEIQQVDSNLGESEVMKFPIDMIGPAGFSAAQIFK